MLNYLIDAFGEDQEKLPLDVHVACPFHITKRTAAMCTFSSEYAVKLN